MSTVPPLRRRAVLSALSTMGVLAASLATPGAAAAQLPDAAAPPPDKIHTSVRADMADGADRVEALVVLDERTDLSSVPRQGVPEALARTAQAAQAPVADLVRRHGGAVRGSFWLQNMLLIEATPTGVEAVAQEAAVARVIPNLAVEAPSPESSSPPAQAADSTWGVERIGADRVQDELGVTGAGVRVAVLDTGVDVDHPDLAGRMATDDPADPAFPGGWIEFDEAGAPVASTPRDSAFHGTHVAGTVLGGDASGTRIGVAPGAELMAAMVIPDGSGTFAQVIAGMQWALNPVDAAGEPAGSPADVVNLSLGGCGLVQEMIEPTRNLRAAGIFPAFAIGNEDINCPSCGPVDTASPGNVYESVAVGATDADDNVADLSCGAVLDKADWPDPPADWPGHYVKPDLTAPGVGVESADPGGGYRVLSGTSMATPHVAGTAALMREAEPGIGVDQASEMLAGTAFFDDRHGSSRPNPRFGAGRIDAFLAVSEAALGSGVRGTVTDAGTGEPIGGVRVTRVDNGRWAETGAAGGFELRLPPGIHRLEMSRFGYQTLAVEVEVTGESFTRVDRPLAAAPRGEITGTVSYRPTGSTVPGATVSVQDVPLDMSAATDHQGRYVIQGVPEGTYDVVATTPDRARSQAAEVTVSADGQAATDLSLARPPAIERASYSSDGVQGNGGSQWPSISADGRYVAFSSMSNNLTGGSGNGQWDVFVRDLLTGLTERVSQAHDGGAADGFSLEPQISDDGRYVGFSSSATNLIEGRASDVVGSFVRDRHEGVTELLSVAHDGGPADARSLAPSLSADARFAAFGSDATNLVPGDTNGAHDIFVRDRQAGRAERISVAYDGGDADRQSRDPSISADGRYVAFHSDATNLIEGGYDGPTAVYVHDRDTGETVLVTGPGEGSNRDPSISGDGGVVVFTSRPTTFGTPQVYAHDLDTGTTEPISVAHDGSGMANLSVRGPDVSHDGRLVTFDSGASNLVENDTNGLDDVFVRDRDSGTTERLTVGIAGGEADDRSSLPAISPDGRLVAFQSRAANLVEDDTNGQPDVFVHDRAPATPQPRFAVGALEVRQETVRPRQPVVLMARIKNIGERAGAYEAVLRVDGQVMDATTVEIGPDQWRWARFQLRREEPGRYQVAIGPAGAQFTVRG